MKPTSKNLSALFKKQPVGITCGIASLILAVMLYFRWDALNDADDAVQAAQTEVSHLEANIKNGSNLKEQYESLLAANGAIAEGRAVNPREEASNMSYFYAIERDTGVAEVNASPKGASKALPGKTYVAVGYALAERGDFRQLVDFARRVEQGRNFSHILSAVLVNSSGQGEAETLLTLDLNLNLLGVPQP
jgi:hypothetical protein